MKTKKLFTACVLIATFIILCIVVYKISQKCKKTEGYKHKLKQNNPEEIAREMRMLSRGTCKNVNKGSPQVMCAINLSGYENSLQGDSLFASDTGVEDDIAQQQWCCCDPETPAPNVDLSGMEHLRNC